MTRFDSGSEQDFSCGVAWRKQLDWLDFWFQPEKTEMHDFNPSERELFDALAPAWLAAEAGAGKIEVLESTSERFGRQRVLALIGKICANETSAHWRELARREGGSLDDLVRLEAENEDVFGADLRSDLDVRPVQCPERQGPVHHEFHVPGAGCLRASGGYLFRKVGRRNDFFRERDIVVGQENDFYAAFDIGIAVNPLADTGDELDDMFGH